MALLPSTHLFPSLPSGRHGLLVDGRCIRWLTVVAWCFAASASSAAGGDDANRDEASSELASSRHFEAHVAPLFARHCLECHDSGAKEGGLDLSRKDRAMAGGESGEPIVPGKPDLSLLWEYVESDAMPADRPPLSDDEKDHLREWIITGAVWSAERIDPLAHTRDRRAAQNWVRRLTVPEYIETVRSAVGVDIENDALRLLPPDVRADGFRNTAYSLGVDLSHVEAYAELAQIIVERMDVAAFVTEHGPTCQDLSDECMRQVVHGVGKWLLRGPLAEHETDAFLSVSSAIAKEGGDFEEAARRVIEAMLQSPRFIYRIEKPPPVDAGPQPVDDYELASRLSYILWGAPPDAELLRAADAGELAERGKVAQHVERMLEDPRAVERSLQFVEEWLNLQGLNNLRPHPQRFPTWNERIAADMRQETRAFFEDVVWDQKRPLAHLINAQVTFLTPRLAEHYGLEWNFAAARKVDRPVAKIPERVTDGLVALYTFEEGKGKVVRDRSRAGDPLDLTIDKPSAVAWDELGLKVTDSVLISSNGAPQRLAAGVRESGEVTLEAWVTPADASQAGPARIVTLSRDPSVRNFTLGQSGDRFEVRLRTTGTSENGEPSLTSSQGTASATPVHVAYTRDSSGAAEIFVNGRASGGRKVEGDLSNWDGNFSLAVANEISKDRPWRGTLHLAAVYKRALSADEVRQNHAAGARRDGPDGLAGAPLGDGLEALYVFDEGEGNTIRDRSGSRGPLDLTIEDASAVEWGEAGLTVKGSTLIGTDGPPKRLIQAIKRSRAATIEAWVTPADSKQSGPARIVSISSGPSQRNFTLGQDGDKYDVRFRTSTRDANGLPGMSSPSGMADPRPTHIVYTRIFNGTGVLYIDGEEQVGGALDGNLSNWDEGFRLLLANESTKDRPWRGTLHRVAVYSRALTPEEVRSKGSGMSRYDLTDVPSRGGLLTQGSVLTVGGDDASMVTRGLFILHDLLYSAVGNPPPGVDTTPVPTKPGLSQRAIAEMRLADQSCTGCHSKFEPLAFGLERFDGVGAFHEVDEHGNKLREDGEIVIPGGDAHVSYRTSAELMDHLAKSGRVKMNMTRKVTQFALGRPLVESDTPVLEQIHKTAQESGGTYASLITAIVMSDLVQMTRGEDPE